MRANKIYWVRHGQSRVNVTGELSHKKADYSLTSKGVLQAKQTAEYFRDKNIDEIYSSPMRRAVETAEIIARALSLSVTVVENLRELNVGSLDGLSTDEAWSTYKRIVADWPHRPEASFPGGEDYFTLLERTRAGIEQIVTGKAGRNMIVVAHGGHLMCTINDLCANARWNESIGSGKGNCSITELEVRYHDGKLEGELISWGACSHLSGEAIQT